MIPAQAQAAEQIGAGSMGDQAAKQIGAGITGDRAAKAPALIIGAGPSGMYLAFQLGLLDIPCVMVDSLSAIGGQCYELYPDKPIFDIPGFVSIQAIELSTRLWQQAQIAKPELYLNCVVTKIDGNENDGFKVELKSTQSTQHQDKPLAVQRFCAVFIASGVGAFEAKRLRMEDAAALEGSALFYGELPPDSMIKTKRVLISGGGKRALRLAAYLLQHNESLAPASIDLIARNGLRAALDTEHQALLDLVDQAAAIGRIRVLNASIKGLDVDKPSEVADQTHKLSAVSIITRNGSQPAEMRLPVDVIAVCHGLSPKIDAMLAWELGMNKGQIPVDTGRFESRRKAIFVVGDMASYPVKKKLIACGFHEATLAAYAACDYAFPGKTIHLQYTTTSPRLLQKFGDQSTLSTRSSGK